MTSLPASLTERQQRESRYYDQYATLNQVDTVDFEPVLSDRPRPWSPFWFVCGLARKHYQPGARLLDFGCGNGVMGVTLAKIGYQVQGFDISGANVRTANILAEKYQFQERCEFTVSPAESLSFPDNHFDVVVGVDILHHVDIPKAMVEIHRVLKPGGIAIFKEPIEVALLDRIRHTWPLTRLAPTESSLDKHVHITQDERKLNRDDLAIIKNQFERVNMTHFSVFTRLYRLLPGKLIRHAGKLMRLDYILMRLCPPMKKLGDVRVFVMHKSC